MELHVTLRKLFADIWIYSIFYCGPNAFVEGLRLKRSLNEEIYFLMWCMEYCGCWHACPTMQFILNKKFQNKLDSVSRFEDCCGSIKINQCAKPATSQFAIKAIESATRLSCPSFIQFHKLRSTFVSQAFNYFANLPFWGHSGGVWFQTDRWFLIFCSFSAPTSHTVLLLQSR